MTARNDVIADRLRLLAAHGMRPRYYHQVVGINSRLDTIQAAVLSVKMRKLEEYTKSRQANAARYAVMFSEAGLSDQFSLPYHDPAAYHVWNQYGIRVHGGQRDELKAWLQKQGVVAKFITQCRCTSKSVFNIAGTRPAACHTPSKPRARSCICRFTQSSNWASKSAWSAVFRATISRLTSDRLPSRYGLTESGWSGIKSRKVIDA